MAGYQRSGKFSKTFTGRTANLDDFLDSSTRSRNSTDSSALDDTNRHNDVGHKPRTRVDNLGLQDFKDYHRRSPTGFSNETDNTVSTPIRDVSEIDQFLSLVRQLKNVNIEEIERSLKNGMSDNIKVELQKQKEEYQTLKEAYDEVTQKFQDAVNKNEELANHARKLIKEAKTKVSEEQERTINQLKNRIKEQESELTNIRAEKDSALSRLSKEMGEKLNENNPGIADLSDPHRSTKLAEKYNSIYDNEWTDSLEILNQIGVDEEAGVRFLLEIIKHVYSFCTRAKIESLEDIESRLINPVSSRHVSVDGGSSDEHKQVKQMLDACFKIKTKSTIQNLQKVYHEMSSSQKPLYADRLTEYVNKSVEICWLMNSQNPPLIFGEPLQAGEAIDKERYREFTKQGDIVSFVVWLPLLIEKDGAVLSKGVVQPVPRAARHIAKSQPSDSTKQKARSRIETHDEQFKRLLHEDEEEQKGEYCHKSDEYTQRLSGQRYDREKYGRDLKVDSHNYERRRSPVTTSPEPKVDDMFRSDARSRPYSAGNVSSALSTDNNSRQFSQTYSVQRTNTLTSQASSFTSEPSPTDIYNSRKNAIAENSGRPSTTGYTDTRKDTAAYMTQRQLPSNPRPARESVYIDMSKADLFESGRVTYALYNGQLYARQPDGSWRFSKGFSNESHA